MESFLVRAIYPYEPRGPDELGLLEGEIVELTDEGQDYGIGWWEGTNSDSLSFRQFLMQLR